MWIVLHTEFPFFTVFGLYLPIFVCEWKKREINYIVDVYPISDRLSPYFEYKWDI